MEKTQPPYYDKINVSTNLILRRKNYKFNKYIYKIKVRPRKNSKLIVFYFLQ